jgi:hypothetical protein
MTRKITFRRQPPNHDLYWQAVAEHNSQFNNKTMTQTQKTMLLELLDSKIDHLKESVRTAEWAKCEKEIEYRKTKVREWNEIAEAVKDLLK